MIVSEKTISKCGAACLCCLEEEIGIVCWQLLHDMLAMEIFGIQPTCELSNGVNLLDISSICNKLRAFERNQSL